MIHNPVLLAIILASVEALLLVLAANPRTKPLFKFIPSMFWIYFLPMVLSTCGIIDAKSPLYPEITKALLPPALFLLLLDVDIKAISRLGPSALIMFFSGSLGIVLGMIISFLVFKPVIGGQFWGGFGSLCASWTGGSANMIAVKEALSVPDAVFFPMVIVDTIVPYVWVGVLVALASRQNVFDTFNQADRSILDDLAKRAQDFSRQKEAVVWGDALKMMALALLAGLICRAVSAHLPTGKNLLTPYAWTILLVTSLAIGTASRVRRLLPRSGAHQFGKWTLYFVLTSIGARASLLHASQVGILLAAGLLVLVVHVLVLLAAARLTRAPLFLVATASLSNMAGLVSAPVVAEVYQPGLACVGLLLAILGHSLGAYVGIATGQLCRFLAHS